MDQQANSIGLSNSSSSRAKSRQLFALIGQDSMQMKPYRSKFEMKSIGSGSRASRDSDLLNRLCQDQSKSSKSLSRNVSNSNINHNHKSMLNSSSNSIVSEGGSNGKIHQNKIEVIVVKQAPKIHNCVCFVAGQCLSYNCNCFLSPFPCAPQCCPNCLTLKSNLPHKISNVCSCKKTKCLKLYCQCLSKGNFCSVMCRCQLCQNHQHSASRANSLNNLIMFQGCSCSKSRCVKKYCECFAQGIKCTRKCLCIGCKNYIQGEMHDQKGQKKQQMQNMQNGNNKQQMMDQLQFQQVDFYSGMRLG